MPPLQDGADNTALLQNTYLFTSFSPEDLAPIQAGGLAKRYAPGETVFKEGDVAKAVFFVKFGSVKILQARKGKPIEISVLPAGSHFGEMPLVDGGRRSATVQAAELSEIISIRYMDLLDYLDAKPHLAAKFFKALAGFLCGRLRITTLDLSFAREKNLAHF